VCVSRGFERNSLDGVKVFLLSCGSEVRAGHTGSSARCQGWVCRGTDPGPPC